VEKVLIVGLDGATWNLLKPWIAEGHLPTFKKLMSEGVYGELESTIPPLSIPAWNSLATGKNPGKLGIFSFMSKDPESYEFKPDFLYMQHRCVWDILGENDKKVIVANVPCVHKAYKVNGYLIAGFLYLDKTSLTYPDDLKKELDQATGGYEVDVLDVDAAFETVEKRFEVVKQLLKKEKLDEYVERVQTLIEKRFRAIEFLLKKKWDFAFVVFVAPDRLQHRFWKNKKILLDCYRRLDSKLEKILSLVGNETTVIIVSDHGFGPKDRVFNINEWLLKEGYLRLKTENTSRRTKLRRGIIRSSAVTYLVRLLPLRVQLYLRHRKNFPKVETSDVDWKQTLVFTQPSEEACGDLYFNMKEMVAEGYGKIGDEVVQKLRSLRDLTNGEKISACVFRRREIYSGEYLEKAPDLVIQVDEDIQGFNTTVGHDRIFMRGEGGEHRVNGVFLAKGPDIKEGMEVKGARIYDVVPTVLHIFDLSVPNDVDGRVLTEIFRSQSAPAKREVKYTDVEVGRGERVEQLVASVDEDKIKERLRKLGYI